MVRLGLNNSLWVGALIVFVVLDDTVFPFFKFHLFCVVSVRSECTCQVSCLVNSEEILNELILPFH